MSDLFGNHIVGFPTRWLKCLRLLTVPNCSKYVLRVSSVVDGSTLPTKIFFLISLSPRGLALLGSIFLSFILCSDCSKTCYNRTEKKS